MKTLDVTERRMGARMLREAWIKRLQALAVRAEQLDPLNSGEQEMRELVIEAVNLMWLGLTPGIIANSARASALAGEAVWMARPGPADADATLECRERLLAAREAAAIAEPEPADGEWLSAPDMAERLNLNTQTIYVRLRKLDLPPELVKKQGRGFLYRPEVVELLQELPSNQKRKPEPEVSAEVEAEPIPEVEAVELEPEGEDVPMAPPKRGSNQQAEPEPEALVEPTPEPEPETPHREPLTAEQRRERQRLCMARRRAQLKVQQEPPVEPEPEVIPAALVGQLEALLAQIKAVA